VRETIEETIAAGVTAALKDVVTQLTKNYLDDTMTLREYRESMRRAANKVLALDASKT
jgi:hypothetical protein